MVTVLHQICVVRGSRKCGKCSVCYKNSVNTFKDAKKVMQRRQLWGLNVLVPLERNLALSTWVIAKSTQRASIKCSNLWKHHSFEKANRENFWRGSVLKSSYWSISWVQLPRNTGVTTVTGDQIMFRAGRIGECYLHAAVQNARITGS